MPEPHAGLHAVPTSPSSYPRSTTAGLSNAAASAAGIVRAAGLAARPYPRAQGLQSLGSKACQKHAGHLDPANAAAHVARPPPGLRSPSSFSP